MSSSEKTGAQATMFTNRLKKRLNHLRKWAKRTDTGAFRLYDRDIPEIPLVLDLYGDVVSGALYKRPYEKDETEESEWLDAMKAAAAETLGLKPENIIIKRRQRQRLAGNSEKPQYKKIAALGVERIINEGGLKFKVNLSDYLDTGLFLDRRVLRKAVCSESEGKRVLNLFCYTAAFSVYTAAGGAVVTDSVDLSNTYLNWAKENFALNGIKTEILRQQDFFMEMEGKKQAEGNCRHRLIRADVKVFLKKAAAAGLRYDIIILDPPAFSNSKMAGDFDLRLDYTELLADCLTLLTHNGKLIFSSGAHSFKVTDADIELILAKKFTGVSVINNSDKYIDEDFKGRKIPKTFLVYKIRETRKTI